jgi:hypothetical protein
MITKRCSSREWAPLLPLPLEGLGEAFERGHANPLPNPLPKREGEKCGFLPSLWEGLGEGLEHGARTTLSPTLSQSERERRKENVNAR